ncbi:HAD-like domain [Pseudocohnilembus persalinus]|uniref:HAD-like domain n=1 Tax=Pseudocohnilembus persalinus TaxID=266149 RepID=A0A0V0QG49_PSEPJ|nr:HAD-like domain [Pseudocohnilembus persalinus]|eukprot:KRX01197.1 HAD-like domain [Pseudocohnilembus persalinus]
MAQTKNNFYKIKEIVKHDINYYHALGFDADHCILRYNLVTCNQILYQGFFESILAEQEFKNLQKQYPTVDQHDYFMKISEKELAFSMNYTILDRENYTSLKIVEGKKIVKGYKGLQELNISELKEIYGNDLTIKDYDPLEAKYHKRYFLGQTFLDVVFILCFAKLFEYFKKIGEIKNYGGYQIWDIIKKAVNQNYAHYNDDEVFKISDFGTVFPKLVENAEKLIFKQHKLKEIFQTIKKRDNKFLFIATNSHYEFVNMNLTLALGDDWSDLFDLVIVQSQKPAIFQDSEKTGYLLDLNEKNFQRKQPIEDRDLEFVNGQLPNKFFVKGNYKMIEKIIENYHNYNLQNKSKTDCQEKIAFFGDNYPGDCQAPEQIPDQSWDAFFICPEILEENQELRSQIPDPEFIYNYQQWWGSYFYHDSEEILELNQEEEKLQQQQQKEQEKQNQLLESYWINHISQSIRGGICGQLDTKEMIEKFWLL